MSKIKRQQATGANCSAMEQRPFQKRVSPKNQRSRNNKMKIFLILVAVIGFGISANAQSNVPIIGYDKVAWGTSIEEVQQFYPNIKEGNLSLHSYALVPAEVSCGCVRVFYEKVGSNGMNDRTFYFIQDKLYRVHITYEQKVKDALVGKLISVFGKFDKEEIINNGEYRERKYHENLMIMVATNTGFFSDEILVIYANPNALDIIREIEKLENDKIKENLKL